MSNYNFSDMRKPAIFSAQSYGTKTTVEIDHSDLDLDEVMDAFQTLLNGMGYHSDGFKQWVLERAAEYQEEDIDNNVDKEEDEYENLRHSWEDKKELITQAEYNRRRDKMAEDMKNLSDWDNTIGDGLEDDEELPEWMQPNEELKNAVEEFRKEVKKRNKK